MTQKLNWSFSAPLAPLNYSSSNGAPVPTMQLGRGGGGCLSTANMLQEAHAGLTAGAQGLPQRGLDGALTQTWNNM